LKSLLLPAGVLSLVAFASLRAPSACSGDEAPTPAPSPTPSPAPAKPEPKAGPPGPPGMVWIDTTQELKIGTTTKEFVELRKARGPEAGIQLMYEQPQHKPALRPYYIGLCEVTNAQYLLFLEKTAKTTYKTGSSALSNLQEIGAFFTGRAEDDTTWGQLYELNKEALHAQRPELLKDKDGKDLPAAEVKKSFRHASIPADVDLVVFKRRLPHDWFFDSNRLEDPAFPDHPVRWVSYLDALAFAEWAGLHVPTEAEWEVAARGPELRNYPWGNDWKEGYDEDTGKKVVEQRCNWSDVNNVNKLREPSAMTVESLPEGRSWCGCWHMLGNVAEWTSTWFDPYEGFYDPSKDATKNPYVNYYGDFVKVIRGGSVGDRERVVLRLAFRNFVGEGRSAPPRPENAYKYVGFRCAAYLQPGLDRYESALMPLLKPKKLRVENMAVERFAGALATNFAGKDEPVENHVYVKDRSYTVLVTPVKQVFGPEEKKDVARTVAEWKKEATKEEPWILGLFATDVPALKMRFVQAAAAAAGPKDGSVRREEKDKPTVEGLLDPGTYILGFHHGHIGVYRANLDLVATFPAEPTMKVVKAKKGEAPPASKVEIDLDVDYVTCQVWIPIGGKGGDPNEGMQISWGFASQGLDKLGSWRSR
jgi:formylglycine-generating enzyme required for sulfatase activity